MSDATHASFFSGVGGLDLGLERAGWRTVSFSEIDPYAYAVLAERWPGVPNLGDIVRLAAGPFGVRGPRGASPEPVGYEDASRAALWTGGFPCQDLSVAGKRRGFAGERSVLAFSFLDLVGRHRPRFVLLENVPGLLSSHGGKDFGTLLAALVELGYGVGYRVLDARYFGVPQRRRRVFILGDSTGGRAGAERAAEVLSVGSRCRRHPPTGIEAGARVAAGARPGVDFVGPLDTALGHHGGGWPDQSVSAGHLVGRMDRLDDGELLRLGDSGRAVPDAERSGTERLGQPPAGGPSGLVGSSPDPDRMRAPDGLAGRLDDRTVVNALNSGGNNGGFRTEPGAHLVTAFVKHRRAGEFDPSPESWGEGDLAELIDASGHGPRTATAIVGGRGVTDDPFLPLGLDSHRYRCCGNGVVADVAEWIGRRLLDAIETPAA